MKVIVIDPFEKEVRLAEVSDPKKSGDYGAFNAEIYRLMSSGPVAVVVFDAVYIRAAGVPVGNCIFVDDEGLLGDLDRQRWFYVEGMGREPLAGIGVVAGSDEEGETVEPTIAPHWFRSRVVWMDIVQVRAWARRGGS